MNKNTEKYDDESLDIFELIVNVWKNRIFILKVTFSFFLVGIFYSLLLTNKYESSSTFYPHFENTENNSLKNLAGLAGINLRENSYSEIPTSLYPNLIESIPYKEDILNEEINIDSNLITYRDYLLNQDKNKGVISKLFGNILNLPSIIISFLKSPFSNDSISLNEKGSNAYLSFNKEEYSLFKALNNVIKLQTNTRDGYIVLSVRDSSPEVAAQVAQIAQNKLQERIINYKLKNTMSLYEYTSEQFEKRKYEFYQLQDSLANFKDRNKSIKSDLFNNQLERLQYEVNLANSIYSELALSKEKVNLEIKKNTPIFTIINPVILPNSRVEPNRTSIVILMTFIGSIISVSFILLKDYLKKIRNDILFSK